MRGKLVPIDLPPGIFRAGTPLQSGGRWYDANLVRFADGAIRPVGGWRRAEDAAGVPFAAFDGIPRAMKAWRADNGNVYIAIGTTEKLMIVTGGNVHDITPVGFTVGEEDTGFGGGAGSYGFGAYGAGAYGSGTLVPTVVEAATWQLDTFGSWLAAVCTSDKKLYIWEGNVVNPAAEPSGAPSSVRAVVVTPERFLVALGADGDARLVKWASQETTDVWTPSSSNSAGDFPLTTDGQLMAGRRTRGGTLLFTDVDVHFMEYIGGLLIYRFTQVGDQCGLIAPNAVAMVDGRALWMGKNAFFGYNGFVEEIPCEVSDYVFSDINRVQAVKIWAMSLPDFSEVWWFYPSSGSTEIDRYVAYNYNEKHWTIGQLERTAGAPSGTVDYPLMCDASGFLYEHEFGQDRGSEVPFLEGGPVELGDGDQVMKVLGIMPDERTLGDVEATIYTGMYPTDTFAANGPYSLAQPTSVRLTARQIRVRFSQARETDWRIGKMKLALKPGGRR